jgi:group I intron endonuclease
MIIYKAINEIDNKCYIGQTINFYKRKNEHKNCNDNSYFHNAIRKHGWDNFKWDILCECSSKDELDEMEFHYIKQYDSYDNGYNMTLGGDKGTWGWVPTEETRKKMSEARKRNFRNGYIPWNKGKSMSDELKQQLSKSRKGKVAWTKLNEKDVREILDLYFNHQIHIDGVGNIMRNGVKMSYKRALSKLIHEEYGVTMKCIEKIMDGETWDYVYKEYKI